MSEFLTQTRAEVAIANTDAFLSRERGTTIDGGFAARQVGDRVRSVSEHAEDLLSSVPHPKLDGMYVPLSKHNANRYEEAAAVLPGYVVLVPSSSVESGTSFLYPAIVSEDGLKSKSLRLHVLRQPYRRQLRYGASLILSGAGQSETKGIGAHGRKANDGVEAEHFATLLAAGGDKSVQSAWRSGQHINHRWRKQPGNSVTAEVSKRLFGRSIPQKTITITKKQIQTGRSMLFWHAGMRDPRTGRPESASRDKALVIVQALGYEALKNRNPRGIDNVKRMIS